jgi:hypothetical protein
MKNTATTANNHSAKLSKSSSCDQSMGSYSGGIPTTAPLANMSTYETQEFECDVCEDTGYLVCDESDGEGHYAPTGTAKCYACYEEPEI